jgi:hypothetical protein
LASRRTLSNHSLKSSFGINVFSDFSEFFPDIVIPLCPSRIKGGKIKRFKVKMKKNENVTGIINL